MTTSLAFVARKYPHIDDDDDDGEMMMTMIMVMMTMTMVMVIVMVTLEDVGGAGEMTASLTFVGCISSFSSCTCCESPTDKKIFRVEDHRCF